MRRLRMPQDPRWLQIAFLSAFLIAGLLFLDFDIPLWQPPLLLGSAWAVQWAMTRLLKLPSAGYLSPTISALGLTLLLRASSPWVLPFAAAVAISSKFLIRFRGKHVFNPTNLGLCASMLCFGAWCSPSQWGENTLLIAWFAVLGCAVAHRAFRADISIALLVSWVTLKAGRVLYLGQRLPVLLHQLAVGSLIIFAFFMISDPKTTPTARAGRIFFAAVVASVALYLQAHLWWQNALIWSLLLCSPLVPLLDLLLERPVPCAPRSPSVSSLAQ